MLSCGSELANTAVTSGILRESWVAISQLKSENENTSSSLLRYKVYNVRPNLTILAFVAKETNNQREDDVVTSQPLKDNNFRAFDFLRTERSPSFSINDAAFTLLESLGDTTSLENEISGSSPLIITGDSIGGSVAALFTLQLLDKTEKKKMTENAKKEIPTLPPNKRTLCITFGSPLIGDDGLRKAVEEQLWDSCFLHVASNTVPNPRLFGSASAYKSFGTYLLCSSMGCACFEDPDAIMDLLAGMGMQIVTGPNDEFDYGNVLDHLDFWVMHKEIIVPGESDPFRAGIYLQLQGIGFSRIQGNQINIGDVVTKLEKWEKELRDKFVSDPSKQLNAKKVFMAYLEWYKKKSPFGYYDRYKLRHTIADQKIISFHKNLTGYWEEMVAEVCKKPMKVQASFRTRWLYAGTNYRRMVEPLDIADYYKDKRHNYENQRSEHYKMLEKWYNDEGKPKIAKKRTEACSMTEDSLFWAKVEEAIISCNLLKNGDTSQENKLVAFEKYVMGLIDNCAVSTEIFLKDCTFMQWWNEYENIIGTSNTSPLVRFMKNGDYENYK